MRIAMVSEHASPLALTGGVDAGGQNVHVAALAAALAASGHSVTVFTRRDSPTLADRVSIDGYVVEHISAGPATWLPKDELLPYMLDFGRKLALRMAADPHDVIHAHFWMSALASLICRSMTGIPVAVTFHALGVVKRRHQGAEDSSPRGRMAAEALICAKADRIIATSQDEVRELQSLGMRPGRSRVVPCGVDADLFRPEPARSDRSRARHRALVVSRLVPRKGIDDAIRGVAQFDDAELVVAGGPPRDRLGDDPEALRLMRIAAACGAADRVQFLGRVDHADVPALMRSADSVIATPWYEPFGLVALEAMACGVPVIASRVGGLADTVVDGRTGIHVPARDPDAIARALALLVADPSLAEDLARDAAERVLDGYTWPHVASRTAAVYRELCRPVREMPGLAAVAGGGR